MNTEEFQVQELYKSRLGELRSY